MKFPTLVTPLALLMPFFFSCSENNEAAAWPKSPRPTAAAKGPSGKKTDTYDLPTAEKIEKANSVFNQYNKNVASFMAYLKAPGDDDYKGQTTNDAEWSAAINGLLSVKSDDPLAKKAASLALQMINKKKSDDASLASFLYEKSRIDFAADTEKRFLQKGISVDVRATGNKHTTLIFKYALVSKAFAYQVGTQTDFIPQCKAKGFTLVRMTDGFDESYSWNLSKTR